MSIFNVVLILCLTCCTDSLYALYTKHVIIKNAGWAASYSFCIHLFGGLVVLNYTQDWRYLVVAALGSWIGTFITVRI